ncbi:serine protease 38-like isoform X2 [Notamacropus eugenii]|uniref:serine protease 38-like isoform X2 n=1 Tax=Notamacropus eugenii TaxID=9315 RepID=UPI003B685E13
MSGCSREAVQGQVRLLHGGRAPDQVNKTGQSVQQNHWREPLQVVAARASAQRAGALSNKEGSLGVRTPWKGSGRGRVLNFLDLFEVFAGFTDLQMSDGQGQRREIAMVIIHPRYKLTHPNGNDIALVQLKTPLKFTSFVLPVCLPSPTIDLQKTNTCWVTGWGKMRVSGTLVHRLQEAQVPLLDQLLCQILYGSFVLIQEDMICASDLSKGKSPCEGDSGGPLVCKFNDTWVQIGVVTWGRSCTTPLYPGVFARVPYFSMWISSSIKSVIISRSTANIASWITLTTPLLFLHVLRIH